jgi:hypothetical protein
VCDDDRRARPQVSRRVDDHLVADAQASRVRMPCVRLDATGIRVPIERRGPVVRASTSHGRRVRVDIWGTATNNIYIADVSGVIHGTY